MNTDLNVKIRVTEIQRFCMHDGPGVRTTVFLSGCPLQCAWCHNPETQEYGEKLLFYPGKCIGCEGCASVCESGAHSFSEQHTIERGKCAACGKCADLCPSGALEICGKEHTVEGILSTIRKDSAFYGERGGVTVSGGEPFFQGEKTLALIKTCSEEGFSVAVETCGYADPEIISAAVPYVDLFLFDIKDTDSIRHKQYTGTGNERILENLSLINEKNAKIRLRCILVSGVNTDSAHYSAIADIAGGIKSLDGVEFIPYHAYGGTKAVFIGREDNGRAEWIPNAEEVAGAKRILRERRIKVL